MECRVNARPEQWTGCAMVMVVCREGVGGQNTDLRPLWWGTPAMVGVDSCTRKLGFSNNGVG